MNQSLEEQLDALDPWMRLAKAGQLKEAIAAYVTRYDWVTFMELARIFGPVAQMKGDISLYILHPSIVVWCGMSEQFCAAIEALLRENRIFYHSASMLSYMADGGYLNMPVAKRPKKSGYQKPHWLPVALRTAPVEERKPKKSKRRAR